MAVGTMAAFQFHLETGAVKMPFGKVARRSRKRSI